MQTMLEGLLKRIDWSNQAPVRFFPLLPNDASQGEKSIVIDPTVAFGRPVVASKSISTSVIAERVDAGEDIRFIARDYDISEDEIKDALAYERAA